MRFVLALLFLLTTSAAFAQDATMSERREADGTTTLVHEVVIAALAADIWTAVSTPEGWRTWAAPVAWSAGPDLIETSYDPAASPNGPATIRQQIVASVPGRLLVFRTVKAPDGFPHFDSYRRVTSLFELEPAGDGRTRVRLTGTGYADDEAGRQLLGFFRAGNRVSLERLQRRFAAGPLDWAREER